MAKRIEELKVWEKNPRRIKASKKRILAKTIQEYGDLSGIVFNRRNQRLVGGHQRAEAMPSGATVSYEKTFNPPTKKGTTAIGHVEIAGERYHFREVDWDEDTHAAAAIAANKGAGEWDFPKLKELMGELDTGAFDFELTGFELPDIENFMTELQMPPEPLSEAEKAAKAKDEAKSPEQGKSSHEGSQRVTFSLAMNAEDKKELLKVLDEIKLRYECEGHDEALVILTTFFS